MQYRSKLFIIIQAPLCTVLSFIRICGFIFIIIYKTIIWNLHLFKMFNNNAFEWYSIFTGGEKHKLCIEVKRKYGMLSAVYSSNHMINIIIIMQILFVRKKPIFSLFIKHRQSYFIRYREQLLACFLWQMK